jgi:hypothetical protein
MAVIDTHAVFTSTHSSFEKSEHPAALQALIL